MPRIAQAASENEALVGKAIGLLNALRKISYRAVPVISVVWSRIPRALFEYIFRFKQMYVLIWTEERLIKIGTGRLDI